MRERLGLLGGGEGTAAGCPVAPPIHAAARCVAHSCRLPSPYSSMPFITNTAILSSPHLLLLSPHPSPPPPDAIELDYALVEDQGWGYGGVGMTPGRTPGRSPSYNLRMSPSQMASPAVRGLGGCCGVGNSNWGALWGSGQAAVLRQEPGAGSSVPCPPCLACPAPPARSPCLPSTTTSCSAPWARAASCSARGPPPAPATGGNSRRIHVLYVQISKLAGLLPHCQSGQPANLPPTPCTSVLQPHIARLLTYLPRLLAHFTRLLAHITGLQVGRGRFESQPCMQISRQCICWPKAPGVGTAALQPKPPGH